MTNSVTRSAIVTDASGGIGGSVARRLAKDGFAVTVNYAGDAAPAQSVVEEIEAAGGQAIAVQADVANAADVERLFKGSMDAFGEPDAVVHCAAIMPLFQISGGDLATFDKVIATNLRGAFLVFAQAAQHVSDGGRIIAFSSSVLAKSFPGYGAYIASNAGVEGLVHVLANELRGRNISVNAVAPGPVGTDLFLKGKDAEQRERMRNRLTNSKNESAGTAGHAGGHSQPGFVPCQPRGRLDQQPDCARQRWLCVSLPRSLRHQYQ